MDENKKEFFKQYRELCIKHNLCIEVGFGDAPSDMFLMVEDTSPEELKNHFEELEQYENNLL